MSNKDSGSKVVHVGQGSKMYCLFNPKLSNPEISSIIGISLDGSTGDFNYSRSFSAPKHQSLIFEFKKGCSNTPDDTQVIGVRMSEETVLIFDIFPGCQEKVLAIAKQI